METAFYKKSKTFFGKMIVKQQRRIGMDERYAIYSHVELKFTFEEAKGILKYIEVFDNFGNRIETNEEKEFLVAKHGLWFSSSECDGGVRFKTISDDKANWDYIKIECDEFETREVLDFCRTQSGNKYSRLGILFAQILNFNKKKDGQWFCSEIITYALQCIKILCKKNSLFTKPGELAMYLEEEEKLIFNIG